MNSLCLDCLVHRCYYCLKNVSAGAVVLARMMQLLKSALGGYMLHMGIVEHNFTAVFEI